MIGLGSMIGAGVFAAFAPAARVAGSGLLVGLAVAAVVAYCNASSSARLAARYPSSGGTYVYGRERLGDFWGYLAGWGFIVGKTASCAAMALTVAAYVAPGLGHTGQSAIAAAAVLALTALNYRGVQRSALATRVIVAVSLLVLVGSVLAITFAGAPSASRLSPFPGSGVLGILQAAGLLFFAFAGYARIATLGEEVRDPARTIPRAVSIALALTLVVYAAVAIALLLQLGPAALGSAADPVAQAVPSPLSPVVRVGAAVAALGSLLALVLGVSRTTFAMARDGHLPRQLAAVHPRFGVPPRSASPPSPCSRTTRSPTPARGPCGPAGSSPGPGWPGVWCSPSRSRCRRSSRGAPCSPSVRSPGSSETDSGTGGPPEVSRQTLPTQGLSTCRRGFLRPRRVRTRLFSRVSAVLGFPMAATASPPRTIPTVIP